MMMNNRWKEQMAKTFIVKCSQKLDDGDIALIEEYSPNDSWVDMFEVIAQYAERAISKSYVDSFTITVEIKR